MNPYWRDSKALGEMVRWLEIVGCPVCGELDPAIRLIECTVGASASSCVTFCQHSRFYWIRAIREGSYEGLIGECGNCRRIFLFHIMRFQ
ncbi:MAG: hypothetical protein HZB32_05075 [Nitrospirae bacterium]|nr:hypothetical protein [Nitrospirota bacterium]